MYVVDLLSLSLSISLHDLLLEMQGASRRRCPFSRNCLECSLRQWQLAPKDRQAGRQTPAIHRSVVSLPHPPTCSRRRHCRPHRPHTSDFGCSLASSSPHALAHPLPSDYYQWRPLLAARSVTHSLGHCHCHAYASKPQLVDLIDLVFLFLISFM